MTDQILRGSGLLLNEGSAILTLRHVVADEVAVMPVVSLYGPRHDFSWTSDHRVESPDELLRRRKRDLGLTWPQLAARCRREWIPLQQEDFHDCEGRINESFSVWVLYNILRGEKVSDGRLKAVARAISAEDEQIDWRDLRTTGKS